MEILSAEVEKATDEIKYCDKTRSSTSDMLSLKYLPDVLVEVLGK